MASLKLLAVAYLILFRLVFHGDIAVASLKRDGRRRRPRRGRVFHGDIAVASLKRRDV